MLLYGSNSLAFLIAEGYVRKFFSGCEPNYTSPKKMGLANLCVDNFYGCKS